MRVTKESNRNKGITLIALVITIIVMLILVGVTISMAVNGGLFDYAGKAVSETNNALKAEQQLADGGIEVDGVWYNNIDEYLNKDKVETISKTESYIGYYADVDADGTVDGVIYADLAFSKEGYYDAETELKNYYVSKANYEEIFGTKDVLTATGTGNDRFYVMALEDISTLTYTWYESEFEEGLLDTETLEDFGTGKANTETMVEMWNADINEAKSSNDVWGPIQTLASKGWFVPAKDEWSVFLNVLDVGYMEDEEGNYIIDYGLSDCYWSSSQYAAQVAHYIEIALGGMYENRYKF